MPGILLQFLILPLTFDGIDSKTCLNKCLAILHFPKEFER